MNSIVKYIYNDIGYPDFLKFQDGYLDEEVLGYLKHKTDSFNLGKAKVKKLISREQKSKDDTVKNKVVQNKLSQKRLKKFSLNRGDFLFYII